MAHGKRYRKQSEKVRSDHAYPPAARLILKAAGIDKGSGEPQKTKVAKITRDQVRAIAEQKMPDLNANDLDAAEKIIAGTARQMGITVDR